MKKIADISAFVFIGAMVIMSVISIFGVWDLFGQDVIKKSFQTMTLLAVFFAVIYVVEKLTVSEETVPAAPNPRDVAMFTTTRLATVAIFFVSTGILALLGVLSIWEVFSPEAVWKSLTSLGILLFSSGIITILCLKRENHPILKKGILNKMGWIGNVVTAIVFFWFLGFLASVLDSSIF